MVRRPGSDGWRLGVRSMTLESEDDGASGAGGSVWISLSMLDGRGIGSWMGWVVVLLSTTAKSEASDLGCCGCGGLAVLSELDLGDGAFCCWV